MDLNFELKIGPKLKVWFRKLGGVFSRVKSNKISNKNGVTLTLTPLHFFIFQTRTLV